MNDIRIGKLLITKKGVINICLLSFLYGILFGATILLNSIKYNLLTFALMIVFSIILWRNFATSIKNEISDIEKENSK
ncbi:hypothetical protein JSO59_010325 [Riemerella anatipestifer]|uniref:hypothetical protein n=1 Tax=Riemerella anatipestifer TaxID=34085 RepID=UPI0030C2DCF3